MKIRQSCPRRAAGALVFAVVSAGLSSVPAAAVVVGLYGGGSTTGEMLHRELMNCYGNSSGGELAFGLVTPSPTCNGVTPYRSDTEFLYLGTGSEFGKL